MASERHKLKNVIHQLDGWTAECTCGKWAVAMCKNPRAVQKEFREHLKFVKGNS